MTLTRLILAAALVALVVAPAAAREDAPEVATSRPGDVCKNGHPTYYWTLDDWFAGEESFSVLCDQTQRGECEAGWKPISVTMYLYWEEANSCALTVSATIQDAVSNGPGCPGPGRLLTVSEVIVVGPFSPAGLWGVTIPLPSEAPVLSGPFFATLTFHDTCDEPPSLVANAGPCLACASWVDRGAGWEQLCGDAFPGNISVRTSLQCQGAAPVAPLSWTMVKGTYWPGK